VPPGAAVTTGSVNAWLMLSSRSHARLYDMPMSRAAAEIEPVSRMLSSSLALPGPMRAPDSKTMLTLSLAMLALCHAGGFETTPLARPGLDLRHQLLLLYVAPKSLACRKKPKSLLDFRPVFANRDALVLIFGYAAVASALRCAATQR
jgi:hypothetical protein